MSHGEIHYRIDAPVLGRWPGHHRSTRGVGGFEFRGHASLLDVPDARRLDLRASLRDPFEQWKVRVASERRAIPVVLIADLSASMAFAGAQQRKLDVLADFASSLAQSAWRTGDSYGFVGCDTTVRPDWLQLPTRSRAAGAGWGPKLRGYTPQGQSAQGLSDAHRWLPRQRALVFVASDFHLPLTLVDRTFASLAAHDVVPVVLWDPAEFDLGPRPGIAAVIDPESGRRRLLWWRPRLRERWQAAQAARRDALLALLRRHRLEPLMVEGAFDADQFTRYFHG